MITGIHHFAIISSSEESVEFYEKLGFTEYFRKQRDYDTVVLFEGHGIYIEMFIDSNHPERATKPENLGLRHIALKVDNIEKTSEDLGLKIGQILIDWIGNRFTYVMDPDGLPVELHE